MKNHKINSSENSILPKKKIIHKYETSQDVILNKAKIKLMRSRSKDKEEAKVKTMT